MTATTNYDAQLQKLMPEIQAFASASQAGRFDAANTPFIGRLLKYLEPTIYQVLKPDTSFSKLMTLTTMPNLRGADTHNYAVSDKVGAGKVINANVKTKDLPQANVVLYEQVSPIETFGNSYQYTLLEIERATMQAAMGLGFNLSNDRMQAALKAHEYRWNTAALTGSTEAGTTGLLNNSDIPSNAVASDGTGSSPLWSTKTGRLIIRDIANRVSLVKTNSKGVHTPNTIALTPTAVEELRATPFDANGEKSTFAYFRETYPNMNIVEAPELTGAFSAADGFIVYENNSSNIEFIVAQGFETSAPQYGGLAYEVECSSRYVAGSVIRYPKAFAIGTGN